MKLRYRLLAASLATLSVTAAHAEVEVYGLLMPFLENVKTSGATTTVPSDRPAMVAAATYAGVNEAARWRMSAGTSQLGFRGSEQLAPGLKAVWQLESGWQIDGSAGPGLGGRNSFVGLQSPVWGTVSLGQWDTPYKFIHLAVNSIKAGYTPDQTVLIGNPGFGVPPTTTQFTRVPGKPDAAFDKRAGNAVQWWTPKWGGFSARVMWSTDEGRTTQTATAPEIAPQIYSGEITYDIGGLSLRYAYEQHKDYFGMSQIGGSAGGTVANPHSKDQANKLVAIYRIGNTRIAGIYEELDYRNDDSVLNAVKKYKRRAYYALVEQKFGAPHRVWVAYGKAEDGSCERVGGASCSTKDLGTDYWVVGYVYAFSKRTEFFLAGYRINNKASGTYSANPFVSAANVTVSPGADTSGFGGGLWHVF